VKPYRFLEEADAEFHQQIEYFDHEVSGLGDKFIADVAAVIEHIRVYPEAGAVVSANLRRRVLRVFRHSVLYVNGPLEIVIIAIAPHRRRPGYWRRRVKALGN